MASSKEYLDFILEQLSELDDVTYHAMMGEYIIYYRDRKSTRLNSSHRCISYAVFCLKKKSMHNLQLRIIHMFYFKQKYPNI